jgi:hypothetical protein
MWPKKRPGFGLLPSVMPPPQVPREKRFLSLEKKLRQAEEVLNDGDLQFSIDLLTLIIRDASLIRETIIQNHTNSKS